MAAISPSLPDAFLKMCRVNAFSPSTSLSMERSRDSKSFSLAAIISPSDDLSALRRPGLRRAQVLHIDTIIYS
jgi:hypothetical protein